MQAQPQPGVSDPSETLKSRVSCWLDGDVDGAGSDDPCARWRDDPQWRATWHRYHLIGDVLRSRELASPPQRDEAFLARLRARLADEPVVLAPMVAESRQRHGWLAPAAVAAGVVVVAGVWVVVRMSQPEAVPGGVMASSVPAVVGAQVERAGAGAAGAGVPPAPVIAPDAAMVRDAEIDRYFRAHREMRTNPAAALPGGAPRNVDAIVMQR